MTSRLFDRLRAAGIAPAPGSAPPVGGGRPRPGSDLLDRGVCDRGHPITSAYDLEIRHDRIRCCRCAADAELERAVQVLNGRRPEAIA